MPYYVTGNLTFSSQNNRNSARTAMLAVPAGGATAWQGAYPAGINTVGTTGLTVSFVVPDEEARTYVRALLDAYSAFARNAGHIATVKAPD
jgi:hypothetical protein